MSDKPISDLRRRMLQDMTNRNFGAKTKHDYIRHIETFAKFLGRAPDTATGDDIRHDFLPSFDRLVRPAPRTNDWRAAANGYNVFSRLSSRTSSKMFSASSRIDASAFSSVR
jgi:hypothetical protein